MKRMSLQEQKNIELEILIYIDKLCRNNNIEYSLCGGTLLGAIRHKGFIPWDDDIDIFLIRPEYEKLLNILKNEKKYFLISPYTDNYYYAFSKLVHLDTIMTIDDPNEDPIPNLGVYIDIFPIDGVPDDNHNQILFTKSTRKLMDNMRFSMPRVYFRSNSVIKRIVKRIVNYPFHIMAMIKSTPDEWKQKLLKKAQTYKFEESKYAGFILSGYGIKEILPVEAFTNTIEVEFEGYNFLAFKNYKWYLKAIYGDYMKLPDEKDRISYHHYTPYWKE